MFPRFLILIGPVRAGQAADDSDNSLRIWNECVTGLVLMARMSQGQGYF